MEEENELKKHTLGICAMKKKIHSPHMQSILDFIKQFNDFELIEFKEQMLFNEDIEKWPIVESMIVFYSSGFPYSKVLKYINLRKPFLPNDFEIQKVFWDRLQVMNLLKENNIPIPNGIIVERQSEINNENENNIELNTSQEIEDMIQKYNDEYKSENKPKAPNLDDIILNDSKNDEINLSAKIDEVEEIITKNEKGEEVINKLEEFDEYIVYNGKKIMKPFVEKPKNGDDHNIYIYYPMSHGGGQTRLFRKHKNLSSLYYPNENRIRRDKSYLYEEYLQTDGFDIKVYTVGENYAHAEERKSPSLDGKVERSKGKEVRYPVNLTTAEKKIARKIVQIFKQNICGFDILRSKGVSYVCDVNGWSFVKGNKKYNEDCAILIRRMILQKLDMKLFLEKPIYIRKVPIYKNLKIPNKNNNNNIKYEEELRSVVAVFRHADRSPKQKMKLVVKDKDLLSLFDIYGNNDDLFDNEEEKLQEIKLKKPKELMTVLKIVTKLLENNKIESSHLNEINNDFNSKLIQMKLILEKNMNFEGMTRKIQLKPLEYVIEKNNKLNEKKIRVTKALLILKWGGTITHSGIEQAKLLGNTFRYQIYPSSLGDGGILRLHSTYRHDLKCYSAEEGRCLKTAASFLKGLLQFDGPITPIITSMVRRDENITNALDVTNDQIPEVKGKIKHEISECLNYNGNILDKFNSLFDKNSIYPDWNNTNNDINNWDNQNQDDLKYPVFGLMKKINNGFRRMEVILELIDKILEKFKTFLSNDELANDSDSYLINNPNYMEKRNSFLSDNNVNNDILSQDNKKEKNKKKEEDNSIKNQKSNSIKGTKALSHRTVSSCESGETRKEKIITSDLKNHSNIIIPDCQEEKEILIYKRYKKLRLDFYNKKTGKFDVTKIPDIYDNIKYDIIHNKDMLDEEAYELYENILLISHFLMPFEYGITIKEKIDIGIKIIKPLMNKIYKDLIWWKYNNPYFENNIKENNNNWSGLDQSRVDTSDIKSTWRHVKTRFYFTCASHMYALINLLVYGYNSFLLGDKKTLYELRNIFDLDYCSHVIFRLYENFNVKSDDNKRFRLEIFLSPGSSKDPREANENHLINVSSWIVLNNNLTFQQMKEFFSQFVGINEEELNTTN